MTNPEASVDGAGHVASAAPRRSGDDRFRVGVSLWTFPEGRLLHTFEVDDRPLASPRFDHDPSFGFKLTTSGTLVVAHDTVIEVFSTPRSDPGSVAEGGTGARSRVGDGGQPP